VLGGCPKLWVYVSLICIELGQYQRLLPVILAIQEAEIRRIMV
jgi:hypothetical protein